MKGTDRRTFIKGAMSLGGISLLSCLSSQVLAARQERKGIYEYPSFRINPFQLGVASGDPDSDGFVIWTRLAPEPVAEHGGMHMVPMRVHWEVAEDPAFKRIAQKGTAVAAPELGHAVHAEITGLKADTVYWYRFKCGSERSVHGRSKTLPLPNADVSQVKFVIAGCQSIEHGLYTAWDHIANEDLDFIFHYGDYIYEYKDKGTGPFPNRGEHWAAARRVVGQEIYSIEDYRRRYALYKLDIHLQRAHASAPWFVSFDDHEIDNNWAGNIDQDGTSPLLFQTRKAMALQAYYENMPLRLRSFPQNGDMRMYRSAQYGKLLNAYILDTRQYRSDQLADGVKSPDVYSDQRTMLGDAQEAWLFEQLANSRSHWNLLAQQVHFGHLIHRQKDGEDMYPMDTWSGYLHSRRRLLSQIERYAKGKTVVASGDSHRHYACDVMQDNGKDIICAEFLATSITSNGDGVYQDELAKSMLALNPHLKATAVKRGYTRCTVTPEKWQADLMVVDRVFTPGAPLELFKRFYLENGKPGLKEAV